MLMPSLHPASPTNFKHNLLFVSSTEILVGGVYIWGNPQLCFPDPQNINWRDTLNEKNNYTKLHRLQPRAANCEHPFN